MLQVPMLGVTVGFGVLGLACHGVSNLLNRISYRIDKGSFSGELNKDTRVMTLNPRMLRSFSMVFNHGISPANDRLDRLVSTIRDNNPDILFLPEMNASARHALRYELETVIIISSQIWEGALLGLKPRSLLLFEGS